MSFATPLAFLLLLLPVLVHVLVPPSDAAAEAFYLPPATAQRAIPAARSRRRAAVLPGLVWLFLVLALAGPQRLETLDLPTASGREVMLALDLSGSMETEDFELNGARVSRLAAVKAVAARFVEGRAGDRVGLVVFGDRAYVAAPLTHDVGSVARAVADLSIGVSGRSTAIGDGLGLAMRRLAEAGGKSRVLLLLSDGVDTTGTVDPAAAANLAASLGIRIHTVALGPEDLGGQPASRDAVDTATLTSIATESGGTMFRVRGTDELRDMAAAVDALEPSLGRAPPIRAWRAYWPWPAGAAALLSLGLLVRRRDLA